MKIFLDSADIGEIKKALSYGVLDGVTTNPSLIKKAAEKNSIKDLEVYIKKILRLCKGKPVSLEVIGSSHDEMFEEAITLFKKFNPVAKNVYIKIPVNPCIEEKCNNSSDGIRVIKELSKKKIPVNCTLIFTPEQALLAAKAGAKFVSPFVGREDDYIREMARIKFEKSDYFPKKGYKKFNDSGIVSGVDLIEKTSKIFKKDKLKTEILAASIRNQKQLREVELAGSDIATIPLKVLESSLNHPKTKEGMRNFIKDVILEYSKIFKKKR